MSRSKGKKNSDLILPVLFVNSVFYKKVRSHKNKSKLRGSTFLYNKGRTIVK